MATAQVASPEHALADTGPLIIPQTSENDPQFKTMHQQCGCKTVACLLSLILHPNLEVNFTSDAILSADGLAIFQLLPLILSAVQRIGETSRNRENFVRLVTVLRSRIVACRGLKLRFLLLVQNDAFAVHWNVRLVHRRQCYALSLIHI